MDFTLRDLIAFLRKACPWMECATKSVMDLIWPFFPILLIMFVLFLSDRLIEVSTNPDYMIVTSLLFAESWWKFRKNSRRADRDAVELIGFLFAVLSGILASLLILASPSEWQATTLLKASQLGIAEIVLFIISVIYAFGVRFDIFYAEANVNAKGATPGHTP
jgi:hypothetical protein